ncbi:phage antirepressor KilAC domain-containing protein [Oceanospirillum maris]|jgi:phage antirepressor YoqD-like protein|uniref:phage antirepressor KilAC domain-containing protein n=1 Tax=Oceanospirillum maris TaxID=64977 RepID=UPI0003FA3944|nr:phage antirepressor KilAC domain-containing protein [Oceanospirillum maris]
MSLLTVEEAAKKLNFPGGRNALYKFLRQHAGFQGTVPPYNLCHLQPFFIVKDGVYEQGRKKVYTQTTKVTNEGLTFIAQLMNERLPQNQPNSKENAHGTHA